VIAIDQHAEESPNGSRAMAIAKAKAQIIWSEDPKVVGVVCDLANRFGCSVETMVDYLSWCRYHWQHPWVEQELSE
jgi:hypothetical protein